ncbi:sigma-54-dependent Fis family transcriptional regulator [Luteimonas sp. BDR2-5]|uniref:sigma-54-dependent Fis family transcriptional regulator n=1 Tax=Proluteimonas luteida TaxID=2878685 RepID=UPI001E5BA6E0|nr:sigma-54-dependent Fis family transcriptional regulator [Luteimonas sp. BDR2-5]MCD9027957.1 sigma-54-dependent Fis family transcriptional regulator [Luteimonas sp. BDR2-5]
MTLGNQKPDLGQARRTFFEGAHVAGGRAATGVVPATILQSWQRCRDLGLAADARPEIAPLEHGRLREMRDRSEKLWRLARAELELLQADASATGSIALLTDAEGWILDAEGSTGFLDKAGRVALMPGACWSEASVGTNAIGTAIVEGRAVEVRGAEHYFAPHRILTCAGAPIFDPYGQLVGVLDISGDAGVPQMHALGLAQLAVANIEHRYFDDGIVAAELLRLHRDADLLGTAREGLLAFRDGVLVAANRCGLELLGLRHGDIGHAGYEALFDDAIGRLHDDGTLGDRHGHLLYGRVDTPERQRRAPVRSAITVSASTPAGDPDAPIFDAGVEQALGQARRVLDADIGVLIQGETGSGKEVFARELHRRSARAGMPFVAVNCAALPEGLIEAELFGYEDGAFTGARKSGNPGLLRQADRGVLFLDEIGDMPLALQPRLLRVLQDRELLPLGGGRPVRLDFALVCATHRNLETAVAEGRFRADLFYRISHHCVHLPSLREHGDVPALVDRLWARIAGGRRLDAAARAALGGYAWPGNLRQLVSCLRTLVALSEPGSIVDAALLPGYLRMPVAVSAGGPDGPDAAATPVPAMPGADLATVTEALMRATVDACGGNMAQAARRLGISRSTLYRKLGRGARHYES